VILGFAVDRLLILLRRKMVFWENDTTQAL
jgi:hypothetical protein